MTEPQRAIEAALAEIARLKQSLSKGKSKQVSSDDDRRVVKATALSWFNTHRQVVVEVLNQDLLANVDEEYRLLITGSEKATLRTRYLDCLRELKKALASIQSSHVITLSKAAGINVQTSDSPPQFASLVSDVKMQAILANRWRECIICVQSGAALAAVVMMGGILEGLLLARINQLSDQSPVFKASGAPKDKAGNPLKLNYWGLSNYLDVAHELKWITKTTKDVGSVVREYRNYVHPQKEYTHGVNISSDDAKMLWEISKNVARQVLKP